eukprot:395971_1
MQIVSNMQHSLQPMLRQLLKESVVETDNEIAFYLTDDNNMIGDDFDFIKMEQQSCQKLTQIICELCIYLQEDDIAQSINNEFLLDIAIHLLPEFLNAKFIQIQMLTTKDNLKTFYHAINHDDYSVDLWLVYKTIFDIYSYLYPTTDINMYALSENKFNEANMRDVNY